MLRPTDEYSERPGGILERLLLLKAALLLVTAVVIGLVAGVVAALLVVPAVPEFVVRPGGISLDYSIASLTLVVSLVVGVALLLAVAVLAAWTLLRSIGADRTRPSPPCIWTTRSATRFTISEQ